ncbi:MAG: ABC transporter ATP-binding protein, partial [Pseudomonadota bacterium]
PLAAQNLPNGRTGKWAYQVISDIILKRFFQLGLTVLGLTIVLWSRFPLLGILFLVSTLIYIGVSVAISGTYVRRANIRAATADSAIGAAIADAITNNPAVKAFGAEAREDDRFAQVTAHWRDQAKASWNRGHDLWLIQQIIWGGLQVIILFVIISLAGSGQATPGDAAFILTATFRLRGFMGQVGENIRQLQRATSEFTDVVEFSKKPFQIANSDDARPFSRRGGQIEFDRVTFGYEGAAQPIYENFSLTINPGERIGLVGPSGSGKSTFLKLIHRLYDTDSGEIRLDGQPVKSLDQESLRRSVALVPQDPALFHRSLAENIAYARPEATLDEIGRAATRARADGFIARLPEGLETLVGERGVKLSGGERQRVAIARAFLADAPIVIFDEATSSLDTITERLIQDAMIDLMEGRTTLIVAHRLSTVRDVDRILVFDRGRIVEEGPHNVLIQKIGGRYRELYEMQSEQPLGVVERTVA